MSRSPINLGHFALFGIIKNGEDFINHHIPEHLGIHPQTVTYGSSSSLFFYNTYGDFAETEIASALKLGFIRDTNRTSLSAQQLLTQKIIQPANIKCDALEGSGLVVSFSKTAPQFCVYQTLLVSPVLYYTHWGERGILCATDIRCLIALLDQLTINEDAIPLHLLFEISIGPMTYFKDIYRLSPGHHLIWDNGQLEVKLVKRLGPVASKPAFESFDKQSVNALYQGMNEVVARYLQEIRTRGGQAANLLSGGVDSSVLQLLLNNQFLEHEPRLSYSYSVQSSDFDFELQYAEHASELFGTKHTYYEITPAAFPDLLIRTIKTLGQPNVFFEGDVGKLMVAEALAANAPNTDYYFGGQGADALHGLTPAKKMFLLDRTRRIPGARLGFQLLASLTSLISKHKAHGLQEVADMLSDIENPQAFSSPLNNFALIVDVERLRRYFGDEAILQSMAYRVEMERQYLNSEWVVEKTQTIDLLTAGYEPALIGEQIFAAHGKTLIQPYLDQEVIALTFAIHPKARFVNGMVIKPFLKDILSRNGFAVIANKTKGAQMFRQDLYDWMRNGSLTDLIRSIDLPDYVTQSDFDDLLAKNDKLIWNLLTLDIFKKYVLNKS